MQTLDRKTPPEYKTIEHFSLTEAVENRLDNGIPLYSINAGTQDVVKIEFIFPAGLWYQPSPLTASTANAMLNEGTKKHSAAEIAEKTDFCGAFLEMETGNDFTYVSLYSLNKHLKSTLPILEEILKHSIFPEKEFEICVNNRKQKFIVNNEKVSYLAHTRFNEILFGSSHPYGYNITIEDFDLLNQENLIKFYEQTYVSPQCKIIVSGKINNDLTRLLNDHFGANDWPARTTKMHSDKKSKSEWHWDKISKSDNGKKHFIPKKDALQSAIRVGKLLFNKKHPDYMGMQVLNTVLGGYFGSRLMKNIREDKGYTYGIYSALVSLQNEGYFFISTETGAEVTNKAMDEIYYELKRLREELITDDELQLVKNYMLGAFQRSIDDPFALADKFKGIMEYGLGYEYYTAFIEKIRNIKPSELNELANKYLQQDDIHHLIVGKN